MFSTGSRKPYTAVTVHVDRMTSTSADEDDVTGLGDLIDVIKIQPTGPSEAARALRKKLKYGGTHSQLRALSIIDALLANAGKAFQREFTDEPLLERLRLLPTMDTVDPDVKKRCNSLYRQWAVAYKDTSGLHGISQLYRELPRERRHKPKPRMVAEDERRAAEDPFGEEEEEEEKPAPAPQQHRRTSSAARTGHASSSSSSWSKPLSSGSISGTFDSMPSKKKDKDSKKTKGGTIVFNMKAERPRISEAVGTASSAASNLQNSLKHVNSESGQVPSQLPECVRELKATRQVRRQILRYIAFDVVQTSDLIGSLLNANDILIEAVTAFEVLERGIDNDSDSDYEIYQAKRISNAAQGSHSRQTSQVEEDVRKMSIAEEPPVKPPRPVAAPAPKPPPTPVAEDDDEDPFGDHAAL